MGREPITLGPVTGIDLVDPPVSLPGNRVVRATNTRFGNNGNFYKRPGHNAYGSSPAKINGDHSVTCLIRWYKSDGTKLTLGTANGAFKKGNDGTGAWTDISINGTGAAGHTTNLADWIVYKDRVYIADGLGVHRYNGTYDRYAGHRVPAAPTLGQTTGGSLTLLGTYKYFITSVAGDMGEGTKGSEATITLTGSNNQVDLSAMTAGAAGYEESAKRIYRTLSNGSVFYFLAEILSATTTYSDTTADSVLAGGSEYVPYMAPPATARFVILGPDDRAYWFGMSGADASLVRVSEPGFPDRLLNTGTDGFFTVSNNDNDILTGGGLLPSGIVFMKRNSIWLLRGYGYGLINITPQEKKGTSVGTTSPFAVITTPIGIIFPSQRGEIYLLDGSNLEEVGKEVASEFAGMTEAAMSRIVACYHDYRYIISYDYRGSKGYNWKTLEFDIRTRSWCGPHENGDYYTPSYYSVWSSSIDKGELAWGEAKASTGSYIYVRNEFARTDRGVKFPSTIDWGARALAGLGVVKSGKVFLHGTYSRDGSLVFSHTDELRRKDSVVLNVPIALDVGRLGPTFILNTSKLGGKLSTVLEGSFKFSSRSRSPAFELTDGGTAVYFNIDLIRVLVRGIPLK